MKNQTAQERYLELERKRYIIKLIRMANLVFLSASVLFVAGYANLIIVPVFYAAWRLWETPNKYGDR